MKERTFYAFCLLFTILGITNLSFAEMASENYRISTSVFQGGGAFAVSIGHQTNSTLGQPSPQMQGDQNSSSDTCSNFPGFWYTLEAGTARCGNLHSFAWSYGSVSGDPNYNSQCDFDIDGDIDGSDLSDFIAGYGL